MSNPTRQEILDAHRALINLYDCIEMGWRIEAATLKDKLSVIEKAMLPKPKRTMAETQWDNEEHYLAEAETEDGIKVVMLSQSGDFIRCIQPPNAGDVVIGLPRLSLIHISEPTRGS